MINVTRKEMEAIDRQREVIKNDLSTTLSFSKMNNFCKESEPINHMTTEQIVLAWHGYVEVEPEIVSFNIAKKALLEGKKVFWYFTSGISGRANLMLSDSLDIYGELTFEDLFNGKFTIEGDNR